MNVEDSRNARLIEGIPQYVSASIQYVVAEQGDAVSAFESKRILIQRDGDAALRLRL